MTKFTGQHIAYILTALFCTLFNVTALATNDSLTTDTTQHIVTTYDSATILPPDTAAVIAGFGGDEAFGVTPPDPTHKFHPAEWIVPGTAAVFGALCVNTSWGRKLRNEGRHHFSAKGLYRVTVDNYLQYAPAAMVYGLNLCGVKGQHNFKDRTILLAMSYIIMATTVNIAKYSFKERRPDSSTYNSFPSGHTATAFVGAEFLYQEYRNTHPWIGYTAYAVSTCVGYLRMHNDRHWANDVLAGAAVGILSTKFAYWLYPKIFRESTGKQRQKRTAMFGMPYYQDRTVGVNMALVF